MSSRTEQHGRLYVNQGYIKKKSCILRLKTKYAQSSHMRGCCLYFGYTTLAGSTHRAEFHPQHYSPPQTRHRQELAPTK